MNERVETKETSQRSPFAGCAILLTALVVMLFLVIFSVTVLFKQFDAISNFTGEKPVDVEVLSLEEEEEKLNDLAEKLELFRLAMRDGKAGEMLLSVDDVNLAIAAYDLLKDLKGKVFVKEIRNGEVILDISFRLNGKPRLAKDGEVGIIGSDPRYLNGVMVAVPGLLDGEVVLEVKDIRVEGKEVPKEFIAQMSPYRVAERYVGNDGIGMVMPKLTGVSVTEGMIRFEKKAGELPKDTLTNANVDQAGKRLFMFLGVAASVFLLFVAGVIFLGLRLKKRRDEKDS